MSLTIDVNAVETDRDGDQAEGLLCHRVAAFGLLVLGAFVLDVLPWSGAGHDVFGRNG